MVVCAVTTHAAISECSSQVSTRLYSWKSSVCPSLKGEKTYWKLTNYYIWGRQTKSAPLKTGRLFGIENICTVKVYDFQNQCSSIVCVLIMLLFLNVFHIYSYIKEIFAVINVSPLKGKNSKCFVAAEWFYSTVLHTYGRWPRIPGLDTLF